MPDFDAIGVALAARFAAAQVTPPTGYQNIRSSTAYPAAALGPLPCVLVLPLEGDFESGNAKREAGTDWAIRFYFAQTGTPEKDAKALLKWLTVLVDQLKASVQLAGTVDLALVTGFRSGRLRYGDQDYSGIELTVHTEAHEGWVATA